MAAADPPVIELGNDGAFDLDTCESIPVGDAPDSDDEAAPAFVKEANAAGARAQSAAERAAAKAARMGAASAAAAAEEEAHRQQMAQDVAANARKVTGLVAEAQALAQDNARRAAQAQAQAQAQASSATRAGSAAPPLPPTPRQQHPRMAAPTLAQFDALLLSLADEVPDEGGVREQILGSLRATWDDPKEAELLAKLGASGPGAARQAASVEGQWDADEARRLIFFPTAVDAGCYAALLAGPKPSGRAMVMFYMKHVKDTFGFCLPFVEAGGLQSLGSLFAHENLYLRSQALDAFIRVSGVEELDWFQPPDEVAAAARKAADAAAGSSAAAGMGSMARFDEAAVLRLHERLRDVARGGAVRALFHNDAGSFPGGGFYALQALAFFLSWLRLRCTPEQKLPLSRSMLARLQAWAQREEESAEARELAQKLFDDFCRLPPVADAEAGGDGMCLWPVLERLGEMGIAAHARKVEGRAAQAEKDAGHRGEFEAAKAAVDAAKEEKEAVRQAHVAAAAAAAARAEAEAEAKAEARAAAAAEVRAAEEAKAAAEAKAKSAAAAKAKAKAKAKAAGEAKAAAAAAKAAACEPLGDAAAAAAAAPSAADKSDYYYFNSDGTKKKKNKWDSFDVDAECAAVDERAETEALKKKGQPHSSWGGGGGGSGGGGGGGSQQDAILAKLLKRNSRPAETAAEPLVTCRPKHLDAHKTKADPMGAGAAGGGGGGGGSDAAAAAAAAAVVAPDAPDSDDDDAAAGEEEAALVQAAPEAPAPAAAAAPPPPPPAPELVAASSGAEKALRDMNKSTSASKEKKPKKDKKKKSSKKSSQMEAMRKLAASASKLDLE